MGLCIKKISFQEVLPSFHEIQNRFRENTGLTLSIICSLHLKNLKSDPNEIFSELALDSEIVKALIYDKYNFCKNYRTDYELLAKYRDDFNLSLFQMNYVDNPEFLIHGLYQVPFKIKEKTIIIEHFQNQFYGIQSLLNVLKELGGIFEQSEKSQSNKAIRYQNLKKWNDYKWYNRPRK